MSQANYTLVTTDAADNDRADIYAYTRTTWGEAQAEQYSDTLQSAFETSRNDPRIGRTYPNLSPVYQFYHAERHNIFYRVDGQQIIVLRVLHERADATRHLETI